MGSQLNRLTERNEEIQSEGRREVSRAAPWVRQGLETGGREPAVGDRRGARTEVGLARALLIPASMFALFWTLALSLFVASDNPFWLLNFGWIGTAVGVGFALVAVLPRKKKVWGRRSAQLLVGSYMLGYLGLWLGENMQLEGFLMMAYTGVIAAGVIHYLVAKILGPLVFGRAWCAWACWTAAVLDLLPFHRPTHELRRGWGWGRYVSFAASVAAVAAAWTLGYRSGGLGVDALAWLIAGNVAYYAAGIGLAFALRDNRAFCKILCPVPVPMKITAPLSLMKIGGRADRCNDCGACERTCPMSVKVSRYIRAGERIGSSECILCQQCVNTCARGALHLGFGLDLGRSSLLPRSESLHGVRHLNDPRR